MPVTGRIKGCKRIFFVVGCYMPPNIRAAESAEFLQLLVDVLHEAKRRFSDPYLVIAGDFNQFNVKQALEEHRELKEVATGPTRGRRTIDKAFTNFHRRITDSNVVAPLAPNTGARGTSSDHGVVFFKARLEFSPPVTWTSYETRRFTEAKAEKFGNWLANKSWEELFNADSSNKKAEIYQEAMGKAMDEFFPLTRTKKIRLQPLILPVTGKIS